MKRIGIGLIVALLAACGGGSDATTASNNSNNNTSAVVCGAANCAGCCFNSTCQTGTTSTACGKAGATCATCPGYQVCSASQACALDPNQNWNFLITAATVAPTNNGALWDADGSPPDPYASFPDASFKTSIKADTFTPAWSPGEGVFATAGTLTTAGVRVQLFDSDLIVDDTITDLRTIVLTDANFAAGGLTITNWAGAQSVTFSLTKHP